MERFLGTSLLGATLALGCAGCGSVGPIELCGQIPEGGCPIGRGGTCEDPACAALYDCIAGTWTAEARCDNADALADAGADEAGDGACPGITIDRTNEASGCTPALQHPDCPADAAETCEDAACLTGCIDFFLCSTEGWTEVAYCNDEGQIVRTR